MKTLNTEILPIEGSSFLVMGENCDLLCKIHNSPIISHASIIITGCNLVMLTWKNTRLSKISVVNGMILIELGDVRKRVKDIVCETIPWAVGTGGTMKISMIDYLLSICFIPLIFILREYGRTNVYPYNSDK